MGYRRIHNRDPRWITARFKSQCAGCSKPVHKGDSGFYYPASRSMYGQKCGCADEQARDFQSAAFDEAVYSSQ